MFFIILSILVTGVIGILGLTKLSNKRFVKLLFALCIILTTLITLVDSVNNNKQIDNLKKDSAEKEKSISDLKEYSYISKLGFNGFTQDLDNTGFGTDDQLYKLLEGTYFKEEGLIKYRCTDESMDKYKIALVDYPKFPFTWFAIGDCKHSNQETDWQIYSKKAKEILEITTTIGGHRKEHDEALRIINEYLK